MYELISRIVEEAGGALGPVTSNGNPSVAYLPGGFSNMKNMLRSLSSAKKDWKIEVLEEGENYHVSFEDQFNVIVPKTAYEEFNSKVLEVHGKSNITLKQIIDEAKTEVVHGLYSGLNKVMTINLRENKIVSSTIVLLNFWLQNFRESRYVPMTNHALIQLNNYDADVRSAIARIQSIYTDDIGTLQMIGKTIREGRPLGQFEPFSDYDYLAGIRVKTVYEGIHMVLEMTVNTTFVPTQTLHIESEEVLEEAKGLKSVKVLGTMVFPVGMMFTPGTFSGIREIIETLEDDNVAQPD